VHKKISLQLADVMHMVVGIFASYSTLDINQCSLCWQPNSNKDRPTRFEAMDRPASVMKKLRLPVQTRSCSAEIVNSSKDSLL